MNDKTGAKAVSAALLAAVAGGCATDGNQRPSASFTGGNVQHVQPGGDAEMDAFRSKLPKMVEDGMAAALKDELNQALNDKENPVMKLRAFVRNNKSELTDGQAEVFYAIADGIREVKIFNDLGHIKLMAFFLVAETALTTEKKEDIDTLKEVIERVNAQKTVEGAEVMFNEINKLFPILDRDSQSSVDLNPAKNFANMTGVPVPTYMSKDSGYVAAIQQTAGEMTGRMARA